MYVYLWTTHSKNVWSTNFAIENLNYFINVYFSILFQHRLIFETSKENNNYFKKIPKSSMHFVFTPKNRHSQFNFRKVNTQSSGIRRVKFEVQLRLVQIFKYIFPP